MQFNQVSMKLHIDENRLMKEVQDDFNHAYPYLKIEFYRNPGLFRQVPPEQRRFPPKLKMGEASKKVSGIDLDLQDSMTIYELEKIFSDQLGLAVQVYRKSGNLWLETTMTNGWSLKQQNDHGMEISNVKKDYLHFDDKFGDAG